ncbi:MAG: Maf family protein [Bacteroidia bacterium]|nr:Maf family protein [Bacteroidia bacterium]
MKINISGKHYDSILKMEMSGRRIILGSGSPRRKQLLEQLGWQIEVQVKNTPEDIPPTLKRGEVAMHLAKAKAHAFDEELRTTDVLINADTIVCLDDDILNKPSDAEEAFQMLSRLSGRSHQVYTGVCLSFNKKRELFFAETTVFFNELKEQLIKEYISHYQPFDKAGSYGAQECLPDGMNPCSTEELEFIKQINKPDYFQKSLAMDSKKHIPIIQRIEGSYFNVMGMPVVELWQQLEKLLKESN